MGVFSEEVAEVVFKNYLSGNPGKWSRAVLEFLKTRPELASKAASIIAGEGLREVIFTVAQKMGINTDAELARTLLDAPDNILRGMAEAYVETAKNGGPAAAPSSAETARPPKDTLVVRIKRPGLGSVVHRHALVDKRVTGLCLDVRTEEDKWNDSHKATVIKDQAGGGRGDKKGKGGGGPQIKLADAEPFPLETLTIADAQATGFTECPKCQPYTFATAEEQKKEAAMAETTAAAEAAKPKPIEGWDKDVGSTGRWLARALDASVANSDDVDDKKLIPVLAWRDLALVISHEILKDHPETRLKSGFDDKGQLKPLTAEQLFALPPRLNDDQVERVVRFIFGEGAGKLRKGSQLKALLDSLTGKKQKAEEEKKAAEEKAAKEQALRDAQAKLAAAANPVETEQAKAEIAKAEKALEPPPPPPENPWPRRLIIGGVLTFTLMVVVTLIGVAVAMNF